MSQSLVPAKPNNKATFLGLPLELRQQIYRELFNSCSYCDPNHWDSSHPHLRDVRVVFPPAILAEGPDRIRRTPPSPEYSILRTCRQVYEEALPWVYEETRFYLSNRYLEKLRGESSTRAPPEGLGKVKHVRLDILLPKYEDAQIHQMKTIKPIRFLLQSCPLLEDLELVLFLCGAFAPGDFDFRIDSNGELMTILLTLNLPNGFSLTIKANSFVLADVAEEFRLNIAPAEKWHPNGWDYMYNAYGMELGWDPKWVRSWSLGKSRGVNLRHQEEPTQQDLEELIECKRFQENVLLFRLQEHIEIGELFERKVKRQRPRRILGFENPMTIPESWYPALGKLVNGLAYILYAVGFLVVPFVFIVVVAAKGIDRLRFVSGHRPRERRSTQEEDDGYDYYGYPWHVGTGMRDG